MTTVSPTLTVQCAFGDNYTTASKTWTTITDYVRNVRITRGRSNEMNRSQPGTATLVLDNSDRRFEPEYASGTYYPDVVPMVPIRIRATYSAVTYDLFYGFVKSWPPTWNQGDTDGTVTVNCMDGFELLNLGRTDAYQQRVKDDRPVLFFPFDEPDDGNDIASDAATTGSLFQRARAAAVRREAGTWDAAVTQFATLTNGPGADPRGVDLNNAEGNFGRVRSAELAGDLSVEFWYYADSVPTNAYTIATVGDHNTLTEIMWGVVLDDEWTGSDLDKTSILLYWTDNPTDGTWSYFIYDGGIAVGGFHCVLTRDVSAKTTRCYVNGVELPATRGKANGTGGTWVDPPTSTANMELVIGGSPVFGAANPGKLGYLAVYDYPLSVGQAAAHYGAADDRWPTETTGTRIGRILDRAGWPTGARSIDTGVVTLDATVVPDRIPFLEAIRDIEKAEGGIFWIAPDGTATFRDRRHRWQDTTATTSQHTYGDSGTELRYADLVLSYDDGYLWNDTEANPTGRGAVTATDSTSVTAYGQRTLRLGQIDLDADEAQHVVDWHTNTYKDPHLRVEAIRLRPERTPTTLYPAVLGADISERVTVKRRPSGGTAISFDAFVESVRHDITPGDWTTTLGLSPAAVSDVWKVADATFGVFDAYKLAY